MRDKSCIARWLVILFALHVLVCPMNALKNGMALRPPMGWNSWNYFGCNINQTLILKTIDAMADLGLAAVGYRYVNIDDCWAAPQRDANGQLQPHPERFPDGIKALAEYAHLRGLKLGIYGDSGTYTCAGYPGSLGHEKDDAAQWASWGVDYVKVDNCFADLVTVRQRYEVMRDALLATGAPIVYSLCSWGVGQPWEWGASVGNAWRIDDDIEPSKESVMRCLDATVGLSRFAGPGGWNDPDMLQVGNGGMPATLQRTHFGLWALVKAPLLIGADLGSVAKESLDILKAPEVIAINQDELGVAGDLVHNQYPKQVWAAPLADGARAVGLLNRHRLDTINITVEWAAIGYPKGLQVSVRDLFNGKDVGNATDCFTAAVAPWDTGMYRLTPLEPTAARLAWRPWHSPPQQRVQADRAVDLPQPGPLLLGDQMLGLAHQKSQEAQS